MKSVIGKPFRRKEDYRLLTGNGLFSDDHTLENQCWAVMVRCPFGHAKIKKVETNISEGLPGVIGIYTGEDCLGDNLGEIPHSPFPSTQFDLKLKPSASAAGKKFTGTHTLLPIDRGRYVGEPIAMVVAETKAEANDAAESIKIDYEILEAVVHARAAAGSSAPKLYDEISDNVFVETFFGNEKETNSVFDSADHVVRMSFDIPRVTGVPLEPRSALGFYDEKTKKYTIYAGSGGTVRQKREIASVLGVDPKQVRVFALDVGGNFGTRNRLFVEFPLVAWASKKVGRPVKFTCERSESFISDYQGRDLTVDMELALNSNGNFLALRSSNISNIGAKCVSLSPLSKGSGIITGSYRIPVAHLRSRATFSNTPPTNAYRSSGRPEIIYCIECLVEKASRDLGFDSIELRRKNLVSEAEMPYKNAVGMIYDSGKYEKSLNMAIALNDWNGFKNRKLEAKSRGQLLGRGLAHYVESSIGTPMEQAELYVRSGKKLVELVIGTQPSGQGHETTFAQVAAESLSLPIEKIKVIVGDTDIVKVGGGSHSGRSMRMAGTVILKTAKLLINKGKRVAAHCLEAAEADIEFKDGCFFVSGTDRKFDLFELAEELTKHQISETFPEGLSAVQDNEMHTPVFPNGCHICEVEIDQETGVPTIVRYVAVDDVGRVINPLIVDGQTHGGIVQGVGQALWEECIFDKDGQPLCGSFMDYSMPRADHFPMLETQINEVPSPTNPLGVKAGGEGGTTPAPAVITNAVMDALKNHGIEQIKMPLTPLKIWQAIHKDGIA